MGGGRRRLGPEEAKKVLKERARLAAVLRPKEVESRPFVMFRRAGQIFGVPLSNMYHTWPSSQLIEVTGAPRFVLGAAAGRGVMVTVIDVAELYGLPIRGVLDIRMIFVVEDKARRIGIAGEASLGVRSVPVSTIRPAPQPIGAFAECGSWADKTALLLDVPALFADARLSPRREGGR